MVVAQTQYPTQGVNGPDNGPPARPPKPERDDLNGLLDVYLAQSVKQAGYRERLIDIFGLIDRMPSGRAVLEYFRERARQNHPLAVNLLAPGTPMAQNLASQDLWLTKDVLTASAPDIGVTPEEHYAPTVFRALLMARNARAAEQYTDQAEHDLAETHTRFVKELAERGDTPSARQSLALSRQALQATQEAMLQATNPVARSMERLDIKANAATADRRASVPVGVPGAAQADQVDQSLPRKPSQSSAARASLNGHGPAPAQAANDASLPGQPDPAETEPDAPSTSAQSKKRRFRTKWISRRFDAFTNALSEWKSGLRRSYKADPSAAKPDASLYFDQAGVPSRKPSSGSTAEGGQV